MQLHEREAGRITICRIVRNVTLEEVDFVPFLMKGAEQATQQRSMPIAPCRTNRESEDDKLHAAREALFDLEIVKKLDADVAIEITQTDCGELRC